MVQQAKTVEELMRFFPQPPADLIINGVPTARQLSPIFSHLVDCSRGPPCAVDRDNNYLYIATGTPETYALFAAPGSTFPQAHYPNSERPDDVPPYTDDMTRGEEARITATHARDQRIHEEINNMHTALITQGLKFIDLPYQDGYKLWESVHLNRSFRQFMDHFLDKYADTQAEDRQAAEDEMKTFNWNPADGIEVLVKKLEQTRVFFIHIRSPKTDAQLVDYGMIQIKGAGIYTEEIKAWNRRDGTTAGQTKTYNDFLQYFPTATRTADKARSIPASVFGHGLNAVSENEGSITSSIESFAAAQSAHASANAESIRTIAALQQQNQILQQQMAAAQPPTHQINAMAQQQTAQQQAMAQQAMAQQAMAQQAMMQSQQMNAFTQQQQFLPPQMPQAGSQIRPKSSTYQAIPVPTAPPAGTFIAPDGKGSDGRNYRTYHLNPIYCPTCGCSTYDNHTPAQCPEVNKHPLHNNGATRANPMGGTLKGSHKFVYIPQIPRVNTGYQQSGRGNRRNRAAGRGGRGRGRNQQQQQQYGMTQTGQMNFMAAPPMMNAFNANQFGQYGGAQQWNNNHQWNNGAGM